jgi:hypothetical protein
MSNTQDKILYNKLTVINIDLIDHCEGAVTLITPTKKELTAFFWGQTFEVNKEYEVQFDCLEYPLQWEVIFNENKDRRETLVAESDFCSYAAYGKILSINPVIADFGDIRMEIGDWTNDKNVIGEYIFYKIGRLDILEIKNFT